MLGSMQKYTNPLLCTSAFYVMIISLTILLMTCMVCYSSALDAESERVVQEALDKVIQGGLQ